MSKLQETFLSGLSDIYDAERQLVKALPKMEEAAENESLRSGFEMHLSETKNHVARLDEVFDQLEEKPKKKTCKAMQGLIEEGSEVIEEAQGDAALIAAAQKVEHYEIAAYGSLQSWAEVLGLDEVAQTLQQTLDEEKSTDEKLTQLADMVNSEEAEPADTGANPE